MRTALATAFAAAILATSSLAYATDTGGTTSGTNTTGSNTTGTMTDDTNTGSVQSPVLSPADQERCKTAPASDTTCQGVNQGTNQQQ